MKLPADSEMNKQSANISA